MMDFRDRDSMWTVRRVQVAALSCVLVGAIVSPLHLCAVSAQELSDGAGDSAPPSDAATRSDDRRERLEAHRDTYCEWLGDVCHLSAAQRDALRGLCDAEIRRSIESWNNNPNSTPVDRLNDYEPLEFTNIGGPAECLQSRQLRERIQQIVRDDDPTGAEWMKLQQAEAERMARLQQLESTYMASQFDEVLELTHEQSSAFSEEMRRLLPYVGSRMVTVQSGDSPLRYQNLRPVLSRFESISLSSEQRSRLHALSAKREPLIRSLRISCTTADGDFEAKLQEVLQVQRAEMDRMVTERVEQLQQDWQLTPDQTSHLRLAGRGATIKYLAAWKFQNVDQLHRFRRTLERTRRQLVDQQQQMQKLTENLARQRGLDPSVVAVPVPVVRMQCELTSMNRDDIFEQSVWQHALQQVSPDASPVLPGAGPRRIQAVAGFVLAALDRELWLTEQQHTQLRPLVLATFSDPAVPPPFPDNELVWLGITLSRIERSDIDNILTPVQQHVWALLHERMQMQDGAIHLKTLADTSISWPLPEPRPAGPASSKTGNSP